MKLLYFRRKDTLSLGVVTGKGIFDVDGYLEAHGAPVYGMQRLTDKSAAVLTQLIEEAGSDKAFFLNESTLAIGSCVPNPSKIICIGLNYRKHALESNMPVPAVPVVFTKYSNTLIDYSQDVTLGAVGEQFDYEVELGFVIGTRCKNVPKQEALQYVLGYCVANDMSCRDLQFRTSQWLMGKSLDQFLPLGKYLVTGDEVGDPQQLHLMCTLNGEKRQDSNTSDMIFTVAEIIEDLSMHMTLEPGDLVLTGTPEGVIMGMKEKNWLKPGDQVCVEIEKLGKTCNKML